MSYSSFLSYLQALSPRIPSGHWWVIGSISLAITIISLTLRGVSKYGSIVSGLAVLFGLFLLDALALKRLGVDTIQSAGFNLGAEYQRIIHGSVEERLMLLFNFLVFVPMGVLLTESVLTMKRFNPNRCIHFVLLISFGLSVCIELLQLVFHAGVFELTDLIMNTLGACAGASVMLGMRRLIKHHGATGCI